MDMKNFPPLLGTKFSIAYREHGNYTPHITGMGKHKICGPHNRVWFAREEKMSKVTCWKSHSHPRIS